MQDLVVCLLLALAQVVRERLLDVLSACTYMLQPLQGSGLASLLLFRSKTPLLCQPSLGDVRLLIAAALHVRAGTAAWQGGEQASGEQPLGLLLCFFPQEDVGIKASLLPFQHCRVHLVNAPQHFTPPLLYLSLSEGISEPSLSGPCCFLDALSGGIS